MDVDLERFAAKLGRLRSLPPVYMIAALVGEAIPDSLLRKARRTRVRNDAESFTASVAFHAEQVLSPLPVSTRDTLARTSFVARAARTMNAVTAPGLGAGRYTICVNSSLEVFLREVALVSLAIIRYRLADTDKAALVRRSLPKLRSLLTSGDVETYTRTVAAPESRQGLEASIMTFFGLRFVVAHEVGHLVCGHVEDTDGAKNTSPQAMTQREYDADAFAARHILSVLEQLRLSSEPTGLQFMGDEIARLACAAPIVFFFAIDTIGIHAHGDGAKNTHPTARLRRAAVENVLHPLIDGEHLREMKEIARTWRTASGANARRESTQRTHPALAAMNRVLSELSVYNYDAALHIAERAAKLYPPARQLLAVVLAESGQRREAIAIQRGLLQEDPRNEETTWNIAVDLASVGETKEAAEHLERAYSLGAGARALERLLLLYAELDQPEGMLRTARLLARERDVNSQSLASAGEFLARRGVVREAISCFERALEVEPTNELWRVRLSDLLVAAGEVEKADSQFKSAEKIWKATYGEQAGAIRAIDEFIGREQPEQARDLLLNELRRYPEDAKLLGRLLFCHVKCGDSENAVRVGSKLRRSGRADSFDLVMCGYALKMMGKEAKAEELFEEALDTGRRERDRLEPCDVGMRRMIRETMAGACFYLAARLMQRGDAKRALQRLRQSVGHCATHENIGNLMYVLLKMGKYSELIAEGTKALSNGLEGPGIYYNMACGMAMRGSYADAVRCLRKASQFESGVIDMARSDPDLEQLRDEGEFKRFVGRGNRMG